MSRLEKIVIRGDEGPSFKERAAHLWHAVKRSITLGPYNSKDPVLARLFGGSPSATGISVNEQTAFTVSGFFDGCTTIAGDVAALPLVLLKRGADGGKTRLTKHPLYTLLHDWPNDEMGSMMFRETLLLHALATGSGYAEIERDPAGRPVALWLLPPSAVTLFRDDAGNLKYSVRGATREVIFDARDIIHLRGPSPDGLVGYNVVSLAREALGLSLAAERHGARYFSNGTHMGAALTTPLIGKGAESLRESINSMHTGLDKSHRFLLLEGDTKYQAIGTTPRDSQMTELRTHQVREVARFLKIPPSKLGDLADATYSNVEQLNLDYFTSCLRPWLARIEEEFTIKLINSMERHQQLIEHVTEGFLVADHESRAAFYASALSHGWMSVDEVRMRENLPALPDGAGSMPRVPMNTQPINQVGGEAPSDEGDGSREAPRLRDRIRRSAAGSGRAGSRTATRGQARERRACTGNRAL